jgi:hypothetical protein
MPPILMVIISPDEFNRLRGSHIALNGVQLSEDVLSEMSRIADEFPGEDEDIDLLGGLLDEETGA